MNKTDIAWCDVTWNPVTGCTKVSEGCRNCYAEGIAKRFWGERKFTSVWCHKERLCQPSKLKGHQRIFVNSMSDMFHHYIPYEFIKDIWSVMLANPQHTFMILTKRADRMAETVDLLLRDGFGVLPNVWLIVSVENQKAADERVPYLLQTPAAVRGVSCEPLLEPVDLTHLYGGISIGESIDLCVDALAGKYDAAWAGRKTRTYSRLAELNAGKLDWVICGGESGQNARPMHPDWVRSLRDQCQAAGVPFFFKQWGEFAWYKPDFYSSDTIPERIGKKAAGRKLDGREWNEYPEGK